MEIRESVVVKDPESGRLCRVFFTEAEVSTILSVGLNVLLSQGLIALSLGESDETTPETPGSIQ